MVDAEKDLVHLSHLLEQHEGRSADSAPAPPLQAGEQLPWPDLCRVVQVLVEIVQDRSDRLERRLRKCLAMARICRKTRLDALKGGQLTKYLQAVRTAVETDVPREAAELPPPDRLLGGLLFRVLLAIFARQGSRRLPGQEHLADGWAECSPAGASPGAGGACLASTSFFRKSPSRRWSNRSGMTPEMDETLERYYVVKLNSLQFCGPSNFNLPFWSGIETLVLTLPMILWLLASSIRPASGRSGATSDCSSLTIISAAIRC